MAMGSMHLVTHDLNAERTGTGSVEGAWAITS